MLIAGCKNTTIPYDIVIIGVGAFWGCPELKVLNLPNSVEKNMVKCVY